MDKIYDLIIIGAGPAGLTASIYAKRAMLDFLILEKWLPGGEIANTYEVENYPGINYISGADLADKMVDHTKELGIKINLEEVLEVDFSKEIKRIITNYHTYYSKTVIIATGASSKRIGLNNEEKYKGKGISYCALCDGALYKDKTVAVIGGGDVAVEDVIYLSRVVRKVYLIHRRDTLKAAKQYQEKMFSLKNVEMIWNSEVIQINGNDYLDSIDIQNNEIDKTRNIKIDGMFIAIGMKPNIDFLKDQIKLTKQGWIITDKYLETSIEGVFAAGDILDKSIRQIVSSVNDGAMAVSYAQKYL